jgi:hypothetical protein
MFVRADHRTGVYLPATTAAGARSRASAGAGCCGSGCSIAGSSSGIGVCSQKINGQSEEESSPLPFPALAQHPLTFRALFLWRFHSRLEPPFSSSSSSSSSRSRKNRGRQRGSGRVVSGLCLRSGQSEPANSASNREAFSRHNRRIRRGPRHNKRLMPWHIHC